MLHYSMYFIILSIFCIATSVSELSEKPSIRPKVPSVSPSSTSRPSIRPKVPTNTPASPSFNSIIVNQSSSKPSIRPKNPSISPSTKRPSPRPSVRPKSPTRTPSRLPRSPTYTPTSKSSFPITFRPTIKPRKTSTIKPSSSSISITPSSIPTAGTTYSPSSTPSAIPSTVITSSPVAIDSQPPITRPPSGYPSTNPSSSNPSVRPTCTSSLLPSSYESISSNPLPASSPTSSPMSYTDTPLNFYSSHGGDIRNSRNVISSRISKASLNLTIPSFSIFINDSVVAPPGIYGDYLVFTTPKSRVVTAYNRTTQLPIWTKNLITDYYPSGFRPATSTFVKGTPTFYNGISVFVTIWGPADVIKFSLATGAFEGRVRVHNHSDANLLGSGTIYRDRFLVGISSNEENNLPRVCCIFVGGFVSINAKSLQIEWTWRAIPAQYSGLGLFSGAAAWGHSPSVDSASGTVFFATGNNYQVDPKLYDCYDLYPESALWETECNQKLYPDNWAMSTVALDIATGRQVWARRLDPYEAWNKACTTSSSDPNCPRGNADADFGMNPTVSNYGIGGDPVLYIAKKSGTTFCLNASNGDVIWTTQSAPSGHLYGLSVDDTKVYVSVLNRQLANWKLLNGTIIRGGGWSALDKITGAILWTTSNPASYNLPPGSTNPSDPLSNGRAKTALSYGPPLSINDMLLVTSYDSVHSPNLGTGKITYGSGGYVYALDKNTGNILSSYETGIGLTGGFSADQTCAFAGNGHYSNAIGKGIFAWCV